MVTGFSSLDAYGFLREPNLERSYSAFVVDTWVMRGFALCRLPGGDDADHISLLTFAVTDKQQPGFRVQIKQQEAFFFGRMIVVKELHGVFINEDGARLVEGDTVLLRVRNRFGRIPITLMTKTAESYPEVTGWMSMAFRGGRGRLAPGLDQSGSTRPNFQT